MAQIEVQTEMQTEAPVKTAKAAPRKAAPRKAAPRKATAKKATPKKAAPKITTAKKATAKKKPAVKKAAPKSTKTKKAAPKNFSENAQEASRNLFLAGLGFYGRAFDQAQSQLKDAQSQLQQNRNKANDLFEQLVKRGEKVETKAKGTFDELSLPELKLVDSDKLRQRLDKARDSFNQLKDAIANRKAA